jgi:PLP dependent protein
MAISADTVRANVATIRSAIDRACERAGSDPASVTVIGASKTVDAQRIGWALDAGIADLGENYAAELRSKAPGLPGARWHFIGTLQTGSAHHVAALADVAGSLSGERATRRLARRAAAAGRTLDALIEVDLAGRGTGVAPAAVPAFARTVDTLDGLRLVGLMTLPPFDVDPESARPWFVRLRELGERLRDEHPAMLELSMGMSLDYPVAVEEGATMVRIGAALFGPRAPST